MSVHDGHRARLKQRFSQTGIDDFAEHEVLELLLMFAIPQGDINPLAHRLISNLGSLAGVLDSPERVLMQIDGVGPHTAALLHLIPQICRRYMTECADAQILNCTKDTGNFIVPRFIGRNVETVFIISLDSKNMVLGTDIVHTGSINSSEISIRNIVQTALRHNATSIILAHNHPGGIATPSQQDLYTTDSIRRALDAVQITVLDHIIVADGDFVSLADTGFFRK